MAIAEIIKMLMTILAFIAGLFNPKYASVRDVAYLTDFDCNAAQWTVPAAIRNGEFSGTVESVCTFEGKGGGGISGLREFLGAQLPMDALINGNYQTENLRGLPGISYDTEIQM